MNSVMWYRKPASEWKEGLPIGNGMLAGMVMGGVAQERVALNHEWLWRANGRYRTTLPKHQYLKEIRDLFPELVRNGLFRARCWKPGNWRTNGWAVQAAY